MFLILIILLFVLLLGSGGGYLMHGRYGTDYPYAGWGSGLMVILLILLILVLFGGFPSRYYW